LDLIAFLAGILFWTSTTSSVLDGVGEKGVLAQHPRVGRRSVTWEERTPVFSGVVLTFDVTPAFKTGGELVERGQGLQRPALRVREGR